MRVIRLEAFERDLISLFADIACDQPAAAERFAQASDELVIALSQFPLMGRAVYLTNERVAGVRVRKVPGFAVLVFYLVDDEKITVLRAFHGSRGDLLDLLADEIEGL